MKPGDPRIRRVVPPSGIRWHRDIGWWDRHVDFSGPVNPTSHEVAYYCPLHTDEHPSASLNTEKGVAQCFACGWAGTAVHLESRLYGEDWEEAKAEVERENLENQDLLIMDGCYIPQSPDSPSPYMGPPSRPLPSEEQLKVWQDGLLRDDGLMTFLRERKGLTEESVRRFGLGWTGERIAIPIRAADGSLMNVRQYDPERRKPKFLNCAGHGARRLWAPDPKAWDSDSILIVAGEWDAMLTTQEGYAAITSTGGEGNFDPAWGPLFRGKKVVVCYDNDATGLEGARRMVEILRPHVSVSAVTPEKPDGSPTPKGYDLSDYIRDGGSVDDLIGIVPPPPTPPTPSNIGGGSPDDPESDPGNPDDNGSGLSSDSDDDPEKQVEGVWEDTDNGEEALSRFFSQIPTRPEDVEGAIQRVSVASDTGEVSPSAEDVESTLHDLEENPPDPRDMDRRLTDALTSIAKAYIHGKISDFVRERHLKRLADVFGCGIRVVKLSYAHIVEGITEEKHVVPALRSPTMEDQLPPTIRWNREIKELRYLVYLPVAGKGVQIIHGIPRDFEAFWVSSKSKTLIPIPEEERAGIATQEELLPGWDVSLTSPANIWAYLTGQTLSVSPTDIFQAVRAFFRRFIWFPEAGSYDVLALWTMATYQYPLWEYTPYLWVSGTFGSGKTQTLSILNNLAFYAQYLGNPTPAVLFRTTGVRGGTLIMDEADSASAGGGESGPLLRSILQTGSWIGGTAERTVKDQEGNIVPRRFPTYGPKAIANVYPYMESTMRSRAIQISAKKKPFSISRERWLETRYSHEALVIRNALFTYGLVTAERVSNLIPSVVSDLMSHSTLDNRSLDVWLPLLTTARFLGDSIYQSALKTATTLKDRYEEDVRLSDFDLQYLEALWQVVQTCDPIGYDSGLPIYANQDILSALVDARGAQLDHTRPLHHVPILKKLGVVSDSYTPPSPRQRGYVVVRGQSLDRKSILQAAQRLGVSLKQYIKDSDLDELRYSPD